MHCLLFSLGQGILLYTRNPSHQVLIFLAHTLPPLFSYWQWEQICSVGIGTLALESYARNKDRRQFSGKPWLIPVHHYISVTWSAASENPHFLPTSFLHWLGEKDDASPPTLLPIQEIPHKISPHSSLLERWLAAQGSPIPNVSQS